MFDIFYLGNNAKLNDHLPFAKKVESLDDVLPRTKMYWVIEPNIEVLDYSVFEHRPETHDAVYEHVWKWDDANYGGIRLIPKNKIEGVKEINKVVCKKSFDILHTADPKQYFTKNKFASHVWCVDPDYKLNDDINWAPGNFEPDFIHSFHLRGQLEHKYPAQEGGIKLYPREWKNADIKYHNYLDANIEYPVMFVKDIDDYTQRNTFKEDYVWLVDANHKVDMETFDWVPSPFEDDMIHVFRMPYQLEEKYPMAMGGIRLVPKKWRDAETKIHPACPIQDASYDVFYVDDDEFDADTYDEYAQRSKTEWFWIVDREFDFNGKLLFVPAQHEREYIHVFKIPGHLEERYPIDNTKPWDIRCGGVRLVNKNFDMTKHKYQKNVVPVRYDIFYSDNISDYETYSRKSRTKMFWLVDSEHEISEVFNYVPHRYDQKTINIFKINGQLEYKYPKSVTNVSDNRCGGVKLIPKRYNVENQKFVSLSPTGSKSYPVTRVKNIDDLKAVDQDGWIVDEDYLIDDSIEWSPPDFQRQSMHVFHVQGQLRHKYPDNMGGLRWVPMEWDGNIVIHGELDVGKHLPVKRVEEPAKDYKEYSSCWLVDSLYKLELDDLKWAPDLFDREMIHVFHVYNQLSDKYQEEMGGVYWLPKDPTSAEIKIHTEPLHLAVDQYPVHFAEDPSIPLDYEAHWVIDEQYKIDKSKINWVPDMFDMDKVHVFHIKNQLSLKYPDDMGGMYWHPTNVKDPLLKVHKEPMELEAVGYPVLRVVDPTDFSIVKEDCWLVDQDYILEDNDFNVIPWQADSERKQVHNYQVIGQLEHKYPETMGGIYWVPVERNEQVNVHSSTPFGDTLSFPTFTTEEEGRQLSTSSWFWVIEEDVEVLQEFTFDFIPAIWDNGKKHVWQKLNPITGRNYDYGGVSLCPKVAQTKGRPKYMREPACTQKEYPVYHLQPNDYKDGLNDVYERLAGDTSTNMYWVVDAYTRLDDDFDFSYYPTQWDLKNVHVWQNEDGEHRNVRLIPTDTFKEKQYTDKEIANNSFEHLKLINTIASLKPTWPVINLPSVDKKEFINAIKDIQEPFVWTIDPDVKVDQSVLDKGFMPQITDTQKIHTWQKVNPRTGKVHGYGGLRLWPTDTDYSTIKSDELKLNRFRNLQYVKEPGSTSVEFDVIFISYHEPEAENAYKRLCSKVDAKWVKDIEGIFNAHKEAAMQSNSKMFWVVDADADVIDTFDFSYIPDVYDEEVVHVWASENPVTGDVYGYGGIKLFNTEQVREATSWGLDFTTGLSSRFKSMPEVSCITKFNTDAFSTWRSAFRECVKLTLNDDEESKQRLDKWLNATGEADYLEDAVKGALEGNQFASNNRNNIIELDKINDYEWLKEQWTQ